MDNSAYVPNHLPPPSLVVFSQAGGLPEALRMQRPFNPQVTDSKDLQVPFSTAASLGYGLHHMLHLPPQFLHPLDHRLPFGGFRPLGPSAFAPPSKCLKVETGNGSVASSGLPSIGSLSSMSNMFSPSAASGGVVSVSGAAGAVGSVPAAGSVAAGQEAAPQSPAGSTSRSPTGTATGSVPNRGPTPEEEDREANATPGSENTERSTPEEGRPYRRESFLLSFARLSPVGGETIRGLEASPRPTFAGSASGDHSGSSRPFPLPRRFSESVLRRSTPAAKVLSFAGGLGRAGFRDGANDERATPPAAVPRDPNAFGPPERPSFERVFRASELSSREPRSHGDRGLRLVVGTRGRSREWTLDELRVRVVGF
ncbi:hypothetical protein KM043_012222 [Ampulex compressa]|nr:hypothetical protein KM043_012222 [Ampulex compressa]